MDSEVMELFLKYHWPGNVRELERTIEHAFVFVKGPVILLENLPQMAVFSQVPDGVAGNVFTNGNKLDETTILQALEKTGGRKKNAAELLGISRTSLWRKMKAMGLQD